MDIEVFLKCKENTTFFSQEMDLTKNGDFHPVLLITVTTVTIFLLQRAKMNNLNESVTENVSGFNPEFEVICMLSHQSVLSILTWQLYPTV